MRRLELPLAALVSLSACTVHTGEIGTPHYETRSVELDHSPLVKINLNMGAGELDVGSGTSKLMQGNFTYMMPSWKPEVDFHDGTLTVNQPNHGHASFGNNHYHWDLRFNRDAPLDFHLNFGAGKAQLDLGSLDLRNVDVDMGVGEIDLDLRGSTRHDYSVRVNGGVGQATVRLPADAAIEATAEGGIGAIEVRGLTKEGGMWVSEPTGHESRKIHVEVHGGIGKIVLIG